MQVYLPIAEMSVNVFVMLAMGVGVGVLSGLFGVGGGFLLTPMLIFLGIPADVAVATGANQIVASSVSGVLTHWRRGNVDFRMGFALLIGGILGSSLGTWLFTYLRAAGQIDLLVKLSYVVFLGVIGWLMLIESARAILWRRRKVIRRQHVHTWIHRLPFKVRFRRSRLYISVLPPLVVGFLVGVLSAIMGVGGGFIMIPAMIYILGMPTAVVIGTSLFQIIFVTANVTILQSVNNYSVDILLALILIAGGVVGAHFGSQWGSRVRGEYLRASLAVLVILVGVNLAVDLLVEPSDIYSLADRGVSR